MSGRVSRKIGWSNESNLLYQILNQLSRLAGIITGLKPKYKVYTALLSQSGADGPASISSGTLQVGVTYYVDDPVGEFDFSNVGGPKYTDSGSLQVYFVATGTTPNSWGDSTTLIYNTGAPVVTVLENTLGNIWFTYNYDGEYPIQSNGLFTANKTYTVLQLWADDSATPRTGVVTWDNENNLTLYNRDGGGIAQNYIGSNSNPVGWLTSIEIRVYN